MLRRSLAWFVAALSLAPAVASANPRPLPFTYIYETLGEGDAELEQYVDYVPTRALTVDNKRAWYGATQMQTEFEYGITNRLELGLYVTYAPTPGNDLAAASHLTVGNGVKQRLRLRLAEAGEWPVDVAFYGEVTENE